MLNLFMGLVSPCGVRQAVIHNSHMCHILINEIRAMGSVL